MPKDIAPTLIRTIPEDFLQNGEPETFSEQENVIKQTYPKGLEPEIRKIVGEAWNISQPAHFERYVVVGAMRMVYELINKFRIALEKIPKNQRKEREEKIQYLLKTLNLEMMAKYKNDEVKSLREEISQKLGKSKALKAYLKSI